MRRLVRCAALWLVVMTSCGAARPYTVDDLLRLETFRGVALDRTEHWLLIDTERAYDTAGRYDYLQGPSPALGRPMVVDLAKPARARPLLPFVEGTGYTLGPFAPDGARIAVYRHRDDLWELGVVTLASGQVRWLDVAVDLPLWGAGLQWRSNTEIVALGLAPGDLPADIRRGRQAKARLETAWAKTRAGQDPAYTRLGSGRYASGRDLPPARTLLRIDIATGRAKPLAQGAFRDLEVSSSGRYAALLEAGAPTGPDAATPPRLADLEGRRSGLAVVDLESGHVLRPTPREVLPNLLSWSIDDRLLIYTRADSRDWSSGDLQEVAAATGAMRTLTNDHLKAKVSVASRELGTLVVRAGWLGRSPVLFGGDTAGAPARADWFSLGTTVPVNLTAFSKEPPSDRAFAEARDLVVQAGTKVWRIRPGRRTLAADQTRLAFTPRRDAGARGALATLDASAAWLQSKGPGGAMRLGQTASTALDDLGPDDRPLALTRHGVVVSATDAHGVQTINLTSPRGRTTVLTLNPGLGDIALPTIRPIRHRSASGGDLTSWLYLPPDLKPGERAPLVVVTYPNADQVRPPYNGLPSARLTMLSTNLFTAAGYAVLDASYQRSTTSHEPSEGFTEALLNATDAAIATGTVDPERMALAGHSFGGYAAMVTATRTNRFKAVIAAMGISDLTALALSNVPHYRVVPEDGMPGLTFLAWAETGQAALGAMPWVAPDLYRRNSPIYQAGAIHTPMLLVTSDQEWGSIGQAEEMFNALWRQGKDAQLLTFWGEGHALSSPANIRAYWAEVFAFLAPLIGPPAGAPTDASRASQVRTQASIASRSNTSP